MQKNIGRRPVDWEIFVNLLPKTIMCRNNLGRLFTNKGIFRAVVVAHLVKQSLPTSEVRGSNPIFGKFHLEHLLTVNCIGKTKIKNRGYIKEGGGSWRERLLFLSALTKVKFKTQNDLIDHQSASQSGYEDVRIGFKQSKQSFNALKCQKWAIKKIDRKF